MNHLSVSVLTKCNSYIQFCPYRGTESVALDHTT